MTLESRQYGKEAEKFAESYLQRNGYDILEINYKTRYGEIDLVAREGKTLVFIEVKARKSSAFGGPSGALNLTKKKKLSRMAAYYLSEKRWTGDVRFDVVLITGEVRDCSAALVRNAFDAESGW